MKAMIAPCGFRCDLCPAFSANIKTPGDRKKVSAGWRKYFRLRIPAERIVCDGCLSRSKNAVRLDDACPVRSCAAGRGLVNCAPCPDFVCPKLSPRAYAAERALKKFKSSIPEDDFRLYIKPYDGLGYLQEIRGAKADIGGKGQADALKELQKIPGVGKSISRDLWDMGIRSIKDLKNKNPEKLYGRLCRHKKTTVDRCLLYVFRCAVYFASHRVFNPELLKWWNWKNSGDIPKRPPRRKKNP